MMDTTDEPSTLAGKLHKRLSRELFSYGIEANPAFQGMEHLSRELMESSGLRTEEEARAKTKEWGVNDDGLDRLLERT